MTAISKCHPLQLKNYLFTIAFLLFAVSAFSQKSKADSLNKLLATVKTDTGRVQLLWELGIVMNRYAPDSAIGLLQEGLYLAQHIKYTEGESKCLGILANSFMRVGNYPRALELNIQKLKLEEKRDKPENRASVLMNIGIVHVLQEEYRVALEYYSKADSVINQFNVENLKYSIVLNIGDAYDKLNVSDTALLFYNKSLELAKKLGDNGRAGISLTGLGHIFRKLGSYQQSLINYQTAINYLQAANDEITYCEAALGLAKLYRLMNKADSSDYFANQSLSAAKKRKLLPQELEAAEFLTEHYKKEKNVDSAFAFLSYVHALNDSVNSKSRIREMQILSSDEQFRQRALEESRMLSKKKRTQQLQMMLIAIFIPGLFLLTLLLSRVKIHTRVIRLLGVLSLLFLFEYLTLVLHPTVANLTNHSPVLEILIFVVLAAILIPAHHRLEHWLIHKLSHFRIHHHTDKTPDPSPTDNKKSSG